MSGWHELKAFHRAFCVDRPFVPPTPRLAIESYWGAHPFRADRLARALAVRSGAPSGWTWRLGDRGKGLPATFRTPPAPYREREYAQGPRCCCVCGQPVYRFGWHVDLWETGPNKNAVWLLTSPRRLAQGRPRSNRRRLQPLLRTRCADQPGRDRLGRDCNLN